MEKQLKGAQAKIQEQENQINELWMKYKEMERLIVKKGEYVSQREKDYYKACKLLHGVLRTNKQLKKENSKLHGVIKWTEAFLETRSRTESLHMSSASDITSVSKTDYNHEVMPNLNLRIVIKRS